MEQLIRKDALRELQIGLVKERWRWDSYMLVRIEPY